MAFLKLNIRSLYLLVSLLPVLLFSQENSSFISLQSGVSAPVGKFRATEYPSGAFATAGLSVSAEGAWFFKPWLGIGGSAGFQLHPVDVVWLGYEKADYDPFIENATVTSDPYFSCGLYSGLFFRVPLVQRLSLTAKALGGFMYARTPYQVYRAEYFMVGELWFAVTSSSDFDGSFLAGAGLRYDLKSCMGFLLNTEFTYNRCEFDFATTDGYTRTDYLTISYINLTLGILIKI